MDATTNGIVNFAGKDQLITLLKAEEGFVGHMYLDSLGVPTVGYGLNLRDRPFKQKWAEFILADIVNDLYFEVLNMVLVFRSLSPVRQCVLLDMAYQMGTEGLLGFADMLKDCSQGNYADAAIKMLQSKWAAETPKRANVLSWMMEHGSFQAG